MRLDRLRELASPPLIRQRKSFRARCVCALASRSLLPPRLLALAPGAPREPRVGRIWPRTGYASIVCPRRRPPLRSGPSARASGAVRSPPAGRSPSRSRWARPDDRQGDDNGDYWQLQEVRERRLCRRGEDAHAQRQGADHAGQVEFGAAWRKTSNEGREYLSVKLDDPSFPSPIYASLVEVEGEDGLSLIWSRRNGE